MTLPEVFFAVWYDLFVFTPFDFLMFVGLWVVPVTAAYILGRWTK